MMKCKALTTTLMIALKNNASNQMNPFKKKIFKRSLQFFHNLPLRLHSLMIKYLTITIGYQINIATQLAAMKWLKITRTK